MWRADPPSGPGVAPLRATPDPGQDTGLIRSLEWPRLLGLALLGTPSRGRERWRRVSDGGSRKDRSREQTDYKTAVQRVLYRWLEAETPDGHGGPIFARRHHRLAHPSRLPPRGRRHQLVLAQRCRLGGRPRASNRPCQGQPTVPRTVRRTCSPGPRHRDADDVGPSLGVALPTKACRDQQTDRGFRGAHPGSGAVAPHCGDPVVRNRED